MYVVIEENPNCDGEERMFSASGPARPVSHVLIDTPKNETTWCETTGVDEGGRFVPAAAHRVEDSSDGTAWLIHGGGWGLRFRREGDSNPWSLTDAGQWGRPFLVFDSSGQAIRFVS